MNWKVASGLKSLLTVLWPKELDYEMLPEASQLGIHSGWGAANVTVSRWAAWAGAPSRMPWDTVSL